jgi:hypothetical protein
MAPRRSTRTPRPSAKSAAALPKTVPPTTAAKPPAATTRTRRPAALRRQPTIRPASSKAPPSVDMKTAAGSGHKRGDLPPPGPVLHKLGPDFQLLAVEDHVGLITQGKPEVGVIKEVHFFEQSGGRTKIPTSETGTVHYYVHVLNGRNILANSKTVYKLPADKRGAEDLAGNLEAKRQKLHHFHHVIKPAAAVASSPPPDPALNKGVSFDLSQNEVKVADAVGEDAVGATGSIGGDKKDVSKKDVRVGRSQSRHV